MKIRSTIYFILPLMILCIIFYHGCGELERNSKWRNREVTIDGLDNEWNGIRYLVDRKSVIIGLLNDENYLYILLSSQDPRIQQEIVRLGLTLWFDPNGGKKKTFGIHFPLGMLSLKTPDMEVTGRNMSQNLQDILEKSQNELELFESGKEHHYRISMDEANQHGISAKMGISKGNLIYELKIPLAQKDDLHTYAIGADTTKMIGIGFIEGRSDVDIMEKRHDHIERDNGETGTIRREGRKNNIAWREGPLFEPLELWTKQNWHQDLHSNFNQ